MARPELVSPDRAVGVGANTEAADRATLVRLLAAHAKTHGDTIAMREKDRGIWQQMSWSQLYEQVLGCAAGLEALGFSDGDAMLVLGDNRARLYVGMLAAGALAGYAMPAYPDATLDELLHFVGEAGVRFVLAADQEQVDKVLELRNSQGLALDVIIYDDPRGLNAYHSPGLRSWEELQALGVERLRTDPSLRDTLVQRATPQGPAVFLHSSGTTGRPKGIVLSQRNVLAAARNAQEGGAFQVGEEIIAYLPMAWVGDFALTVAAGIAYRFVVNIPERQETVLHDMREVAPTLYLSSPRSWDTLLTTIQVRMEDSTRLKKWIYRSFMDRAVAAERRKLQGAAPGLGERLWRRLGEWLVFGPIKDQFGMSRLRNAFTGGEAIGEDTFVFYRALGVKLRQLYGQTENSAFSAIQSKDEVRLHSVGRPLPGVEVKISEQGEILLRSESVFSGYFNRPDATRDALEGGWLHTGDAGYIEPDGHLVVLGRLSEVVHTASGERYVPNYIENRLKFSPYIKDAAVVGAGRDYLVAMLCIDLNYMGHWAELHGIPYMSYADLSQRPEVLDLLTQALQGVNEALPEPLRIRRFVSLHKEFDPDDGEITRTRKLRRSVIEELYAPVIEALYAGREAITVQAQITYENGEMGVIERTLSVQEV